MLTGTGVALITPFTSAGEVDYASLERTVNNLINGRVDFLVVLGTTGESATLTDEEKQQIVQCVAVATRGRVPLVLGAGGNDTAALVRSLQTIDTSAFPPCSRSPRTTTAPRSKGSMRISLRWHKLARCPSCCTTSPRAPA